MSLPLPLLPHHNRVVSVWLLTAGLGSFCLTGCIAVMGGRIPDFLPTMYVFIELCLFSGLLSSPVLLLLPACIRWALQEAAFAGRHFRLFLVIEGVSSMVAGGMFLLAKLLMNGPRNTNVLWFVAPYAVVALLVTYWRYARWLFPLRPQS